MSIFGSIMSKIFHHAEAAPAGGGTSTSDSTPVANAGAAPENAARPTAPIASHQDATSTSASTPDAGASNQIAQNDPTSTPAPGAGPGAPQNVDVAAILNGLAAKSSEKLDWRHSIVDMMKLLGLDSSLSARQELAKELSYSGDTHDSASMNMWLHKQVMQKLAANGGKVPDDLKA